MFLSLITGIDIGYQSLKAVMLKPIRQQFALIGCKELTINSAIFAENHILNHQEIVRTLKLLKKQLPYYHRQVALAIPDSTVISKTANIHDSLSGRAREFAISHDLSKQSPVDVEELCFDYTRLSGVPHEDLVAYQVFGARKEIVEPRRKACVSAGLFPVLIDVQGHCLLHLWQMALEQQPYRQQYVLLDINRQRALLCIADCEGKPLYKELPRQLFSSVDEMDINEQRWRQEVALRIRAQLQLLCSVHETLTIRGVSLCGDYESMPQLADILSHLIALPCDIFNPFSVLSCEIASDDSDCRYALATGIALNGLLWLQGSHDA